MVRTLAFLLCSLCICSEAFVPRHSALRGGRSQQRRKAFHACATTPDPSFSESKEGLKKELLRRCAVCDRGQHASKISHSPVNVAHTASFAAGIRARVCGAYSFLESAPLVYTDIFRGCLAREWQERQGSGRGLTSVW